MYSSIFLSFNQYIYDWDAFTELGKTSFGRESAPLLHTFPPPWPQLPLCLFTYIF